MNTKNLMALAQYLYNPPPQMMPFDMSCYVEINGEALSPEEYEVHSSGENVCNTAACAIGEATALFPTIKEDHHWSGYAKRVFGIHEGTGEVGPWCFAANWSHLDNTPQGAALRILYLVKHGRQPDFFCEVDLDLCSYDDDEELGLDYEENGVERRDNLVENYHAWKVVFQEEAKKEFL